MTNPKSVNRSVYESADMIALRLRAAKKPAVIPFLEIPPEEIDLEPVTIEPVDLTDAEPVPIMPLVVPVSEILPFDDDEGDAGGGVAQVISEPSTAPAGGEAKSPTAPAGNDGMSLFGVGTIIDSKPPKERGGSERRAKERGKGRSR